MSAAWLDPFSARLHAIHRKGAKDRAQPLAPKAATGVIERQRSHSSWDDPPSYRSDSLKAFARGDDPPGPRVDDARDDDAPVYRTWEREAGRALEEQERTSARDDDTREDIRMLKRRLGALENEVKSLKERIDELTYGGARPVQVAGEGDYHSFHPMPPEDGDKQWFQSMSCDADGCPPPPSYVDGSGRVPQHLRTDPYRNQAWAGDR